MYLIVDAWLFTVVFKLVNVVPWPSTVLINFVIFALKSSSDFVAVSS
ncbi:hypothetical protein [Candidatus Phytoplasma ziziphi]|nr:hypothetical protein [Candidatus Phytoplasma ziziphi]